MVASSVLLLPLCVFGGLLQVADYASTRLAVERGKGAEGNPLLQSLMLAFGFRTVLIAAKLLGVGVFGLLYILEADWRLIAALDVLYLVVVLNNRRIANR